MKFYQKLDGGVNASAREYDVAAGTAIEEGQVVKLADGLVAGAAADESGAVLGVAAESHSGAADALDPRASGTKILVIDDPEAVFQCKAPEVEASGGSETTLETAGLKAFAADDFNGGYVKLLAKAAGSANTDEIGTVRHVTGFAADGAKGTLTVESGGAPSAGDVYALFPPLGFAKGSLNGAKTALALTAAGSLPLKVVGHDRAMGKINLIAKKHFLAVEA